jgi:vanillate/3-O-methylgallate O-demethylase
MSPETLESRLGQWATPIEMLRNSPSRRFRFPYPDQYTTWQDEQAAWRKSAVLFDQSHHMTDVYLKGPDIGRLLEHTATNSFRTFGRDKAKHMVVCNDDGNMIGTCVLFGLENDEVNLVGPAAAANWVQYQAEIGGYDVEVTRDERSSGWASPDRRQTYRYEIEGPHAWSILEKAAGTAIERVPFFAMTEFTIGGHRVRALSHTMAGVPGADSMGLEIFGPAADGPAVKDAILTAGDEYGLVMGGALAYYTGGTESGYAAQPTPAIYTGTHLKAYREWLPADGYEGSLSLGGSYRSENVEDYYVTPFDFGYGHLVKFDHEFIGREALEQAAARPGRTKVWLRWNDEDVARVYASSLFDGDRRAKYLETPLARYSRVHTDAVLVDEQHIGVSTLAAYTVNVGSWMSVGFLDEAHARDGAEICLLWGEESGGTAKLTVEHHAQTTIRATVSTCSLVR